MSTHLEQARRATRAVPAPFRLRCGALLVDYTVVILILAFSTLAARLLDRGARWAGDTALTLGYLVAAAAVVLNFVLLTVTTGRTFGKWVTGLRIERTDGRSVGAARAALRYLVGYPLTLLTLGLGFLVAAFTPGGRALHDYVAGTIVVRDRGRARRAHAPAPTQKGKTAAPARA
ncbi:MAG TPA: RDD family protein [Pyrinomonadaceae bacterium]|nr:RDD family protein [Pyrinomonadaceae bacterium]